MVNEIAVGGAALGIDLLRRVLGGSANEVGEALRRLTEYRLRNVGRVVENAAGKVSDEAGEVPMRVAMRVLEEASNADDAAIVDYLGGVLASSHTLVGRDDRGAAWTALISTMSTYQLRFHYILYREFRRLVMDQTVNLAEEGTSDYPIFIPMDDYRRAMEFGENEDEDSLTGHVLIGLFRLGLLQERFTVAGSKNVLWRHWHGDITTGGFVGTITIFGVELFLWALGWGGSHVNTIIDPAAPLEDVFADVPATPGARLVQRGRSR